MALRTQLAFLTNLQVEHVSDTEEVRLHAVGVLESAWQEFKLPKWVISNNTFSTNVHLLVTTFVEPFQLPFDINVSTNYTTAVQCIWACSSARNDLPKFKLTFNTSDM